MFNFNDDKNNAIYFTDRKSEYDILSTAFDNLMMNNQYCELISIYGIGGIGKSRLVNYALEHTEHISHQNLKVLNINLEIVKSDNILTAIVGLRKQIPTTCPLFDYAIINFWNKFSPTEFSTDFSRSILEQAVEYLFGISSISYKRLSISSLIPKVLSTLKKAYSHTLYKSQIENMDSKEFIKKLPEFIGIDIRMKYFDKYLIMFIDSYEQYQTNWIEELITNIGFGVYIITSREKLKWKNKNIVKIKEIELNALPEDDTRELLSKYDISNKQYANILSVTDCIPVYLELAIQTLQNNASATNFFFEDKEDIVNKFFDHLSVEKQKLLMILSIVQIFNKEIFSLLIHELNINISMLEYNEIVELSIIQNVEQVDDFYKIHDVVSDNIQHICSAEDREIIYEAYISTINKCNLLDTQKILLYKHSLSLFIKNGFVLNETKSEILLDLFFKAKGTLLPIDYNSVSKFETNSELKPIYFFTKAAYNERASSTERLLWLDSILNEANIFGKHIKSYNILRGYVLGLVKDQTELYKILTIINDSLSDNEIDEWYFGQAKIFLGDYYVTQGKFLEAKTILTKYKNQIAFKKSNNNYAFQVNRHLGHMYRFNMFCEEAKKQYDNALTVNEFSSELQKLYIFTNYCETACLYDYSFVEKHYNDYLKLCKKYNDLKSMAKIYSSAAIIYIKKNKFKRARKLIRKSLYFNYLDGYNSGIMFSYLHFLYLEKKMYGHITENIVCCFLNQNRIIKRYHYLKLPLYILTQNEREINNIKKDFEWLDFDRTINEYKRFFNEIGLDCD